MPKAAMSLPKLIVADSEQNADILYATRFFVPDPFVYLNVAGVSFIVLNDLEVDRGLRTAKVDHVVSWSDLEKEMKGTSRKKVSFAAVLAFFLKARKVRRCQVPADFPLGLAGELAKLGIRVIPVRGLFWPEREFKTDGEMDSLRRALRMTEAGMARAMEVLKASTPRRDGVLRWGNAVLTSELLRAEADVAMLRAGARPGNSIVAGGEQACDPHERGSGPLRANELIIIDLFPRSADSGYFGDLTRTVVRGVADDAQRRLWKVCLEGQKKALSQLRPGVDGLDLQSAIREDFARKGFPTERRNGRWTGFFHGLGHGLGLEIHETPRLSATKLTERQVVTVEPGIYVPGIGGVRHEDVVAITGGGCRLLSRFPKPLEI